MLEDIFQLLYHPLPVRLQIFIHFFDHLLDSFRAVVLDDCNVIFGQLIGPGM